MHGKAIQIQDWGFDPDLLKYVEENFSGGFRVTALDDIKKERLAFKARAEKWFDELGINYHAIATFLSIQKPESGDGYAEGYPHVHHPVIIHYLDVSDVPTPLHIFDQEDGKVVEELIPEPGMAVYVPGKVWHGVPKHKGSTSRIQIIAMAKT